MIEIQKFRLKEVLSVIQYDGTEPQALEIVEKYNTSDRVLRVYYTNSKKLFWTDGYGSNFTISNGDYLVLGNKMQVIEVIPQNIMKDKYNKISES